MPNDTLVVESSSGAKPGETILSCFGPFTIQTLFSFQSAVRQIESAPFLILDLTGVPYMDSAGLGALVGAFVSGRKSNRRIVLVGAGERITALIRMSNLEQFLPLYGSRAEAESALAGASGAQAQAST
jgi:anti-sigma B factor antagonist